MLEPKTNGSRVDESLWSVELSDQMMIVNNATDNIFTTFSMRVDMVSCLTTSLYCLSLRTCIMKKFMEIMKLSH